MKLSELIEYVGDDFVQFQNLHEDMVQVYNSKNKSSVEFTTDPRKVTELAHASLTGDKCSFVGLIVWLPRERLPEKLM